MIATIEPGAATDTVPTHPGGGVWLYAVIDGQGGVTFSDSATELVALTVPGYASLAGGNSWSDPDPADAATQGQIEAGHDEGLGLRYDYLVVLAQKTQTWMNSEAVLRGDLVPANASDDTLTALFADRSLPFEGRDTADGGVDVDWQMEVPLVLLATDYQPYTARPVPTGRIVWLDPITEVTFLRSLAELGIIEFQVLARQ